MCIAKIIACKNCMYKKECEGALKKGNFPPCTKTSTVDPFNNNISI